MKNLVSSSQHLGRSQRSRSLQTRTLRCSRIREEQANPSHAGVRRGSTRVAKTGRNWLHTNKPGGACHYGQDTACSQGNKQGTNPAHGVWTPAHYKATLPLTAHSCVKNWCWLSSNELKLWDVRKREALKTLRCRRRMGQREEWQTGRQGHRAGSDAKHCGPPELSPRTPLSFGREEVGELWFLSITLRNVCS